MLMAGFGNRLIKWVLITNLKRADCDSAFWSKATCRNYGAGRNDSPVRL